MLERKRILIFERSRASIVLLLRALANACAIQNKTLLIKAQCYYVAGAHSTLAKIEALHGKLERITFLQQSTSLILFSMLQMFDKNIMYSQSCDL